MIGTTIRRLAITLACAAVSSAAMAQAPDPKPKADEPKRPAPSDLVLRVYDVSDLVQSVPDYPYRSGLPTTGDDGGSGRPCPRLHRSG